VPETQSIPTPPPPPLTHAQRKTLTNTRVNSRTSKEREPRKYRSLRGFCFQPPARRFCSTSFQYLHVFPHANVCVLVRQRGTNSHAPMHACVQRAEMPAQTYLAGLPGWSFRREAHDFVLATVHARTRTFTHARRGQAHTHGACWPACDVRGPGRRPERTQHRICTHCEREHSHDSLLSPQDHAEARALQQRFCSGDLTHASTHAHVKRTRMTAQTRVQHTWSKAAARRWRWQGARPGFPAGWGLLALSSRRVQKVRPSRHPSRRRR